MSNPKHGKNGSLFSPMRMPLAPAMRENFRLPDVSEHAVTLVAIEQVLRSGGAIMIGRTSDGGAIAVTLFDGDEKVRAYPTNADEYNATMQEVMQRFA